ncbi:uncharacterized protein LDX57_005015 [Aspergillus melleus]|uniref:uncharacterized protein n=1 Tax=Aspergillus melleus TaxID=138277 RepID=UPI001E8E929F|nr:uncharacterized protein LDX57_005015 [Aspergillus melleus]KAH8427301.1 hypothetical protein LDX57_005015 [Aspergillus melleus]
MRWYWIFLALSVLLAAAIARPLVQDAHLPYQSDIGEGKYYSTSATDAVQFDAQPGATPFNLLLQRGP